MSTRKYSERSFQEKQAYELERLKRKLEDEKLEIIESAPATTEQEEDYSPSWVKERTVIPLEIGNRRRSLTDLLMQGINAFRFSISKAVDILLVKKGIIKYAWVQSEVDVPALNPLTRKKEFHKARFAIVIDYFRLETEEEARKRWLSEVNPNITYLSEKPYNTQSSR